jgi:hypothetical protein
MTLDKCRKVCKGISVQIFGKFTKYVFVVVKKNFERKKFVENNETTILRAMHFSRKFRFFVKIKPVPFPPYEQNNSKWFRPQAWAHSSKKLRSLC